MTKNNILIVGATGFGKSSTINALLGKNVARVGTGVEPETKIIRKFENGRLALWDTPGLGDGKEPDSTYKKMIADKLNETDDEGYYLIDKVLLVIDGGMRDLGTSTKLINSVLIPALGEDCKDCIIVGVNQADMAMKGRNWNAESSTPNETLECFLENKRISVRDRLYEATGLRFAPLCYSAGYMEANGVQRKPYNIDLLAKKLESPSAKVFAQQYRDSNDALNTTNGMFEKYDDIIKEVLGRNDFNDLYDERDFGSSPDFGGTVMDLLDDFVFNPVDTVLGGIIDFFDGLF